MTSFSRRIHLGIRYGGARQDRHEAVERERERRVQGTRGREEASNNDDSTIRKPVSVTRTQKLLSREDIDWESIPIDEFDLDCELAIEILVARLKTYTLRNQQLALEFIAELRKLVVERGGDKVTFRVTGVGTFAQRKVLRLEYRVGDGEVREQVIPGGFRNMCQGAITRKPRPNNDMFFPKRWKSNWKYRFPFED